MHELGITRALINQIIDECNKSNIRSTKKVIIELGSLTTYKKESIQYYFDILKADHEIVRGSKLVVNDIPGKVRCNECKRQSLVHEDYLILCPKCNSMDVDIIGGREFSIMHIEGE